jgi:hypothetical protein
MRLVSICWFHFWFGQVSIVAQINGVYVDGWMDGWMDDTHYALEHTQVQPVDPTSNGHRHTSCCVDPAPLEPVNPP